MAMSEKAQKALKDVKNSLYILYGADYFTEEEWIKIDFLVHKGKYVFTSGPSAHPPRNILEHESEPLMTFEETKEPTVSVEQKGHLETTTNETFEMVEKQASGPNSSDGDLVAHEETLNETSAESSSDDDSPAPSSGLQNPEPSQSATPLSSVAVETPRNGLLVGYTQAQLDEVKAFNAGLTKAGQKSRPTYAPIEEYPSSTWEDDITETAKEYQFSSPASTEREDRISIWASDVDAAETTSASIISPTPEPSKAILAEEFTKSHGRSPKSINDFFQPNNPQHNLGSKRPGSRASAKTAESVQSSRTIAPTIAERLPSASNRSTSRLKVTPGTTLIAQRTAPKTFHIGLSVEQGDAIEVLKHVSGTRHLGRNLRTKEHGQFAETIFIPSDETLAQQRELARKKAAEENLTVEKAAYQTEAERLATARKALDQVENTNAAAWDEVPVRRSQSTALIVAQRAASSGTGLAASRFSKAEHLEESSQVVVYQNQNITPAMQAEFGKIVDLKVQQILKAHGVASSPPPNTLTKNFSRSLGPAPVKTNICWHWKTGKGCRFTEEECRDLHYYPSSSSGTALNLHNGKPTWGAAADYAASPTSSVAASSPLNVKTCYYWATEGKCYNTAEDCRFLHAHTSSGIAAKPGGVQKWGAGSWKKNDEAEEEGELVLERASDAWGQGSSWGETNAEGSGWGDDKYKPPHIVALEDKNRKEALGW